MFMTSTLGSNVYFNLHIIILYIQPYKDSNINHRDDCCGRLHCRVCLAPPTDCNTLSNGSSLIIHVHKLYIIIIIEGGSTVNIISSFIINNYGACIALQKMA